MQTMISLRICVMQILIISVIVALLFPSAVVAAATYQSPLYIYAKADPQKRHWADIRAQCNFPDKVRITEQFQVQISLRYLKNENASLPWIEFFDVTVHTRKLPTGQNSTSSKSDTSRQRVAQGGQYIGNFTITAPSEYSEFFVALTWRTYDPGGKAYNLTKPAEELRWDTGNSQEILGARIAVLKSQVELTVRLENVKAAEIKIQGQSRKVETGEVKVTLPIGSTCTIEVPKEVDVAVGTRALFVKWSNGETSNTRKAVLTDDLVAIAIYRIQYLLTVISDRGNPQGQDWYDPGAVATFSVSSSVEAAGLMGLIGGKSTFDHWIGDFAGGVSVGTIRMTSPKTVTAVWKTPSIFETHLPQLLGGIGTVGSLFVGWLFKTRKQRLVSTYLGKIDSAHNNYFANRQECKNQLTKLRDEITFLLKKNKIDASQFTILDGKIDRYLRGLEESRR